MRILLFLLMIAGCSISPSQIPKMSDLAGLWVNREYSEILKTRRSPREAFNARDGLICFCEIDSNGIQWGIHDGNGFGVRRLEPTQTSDEFRLVGRDNSPMDHRFLIDRQGSTGTLTWIWGGNGDSATVQVFDRIHVSIEQYCNALLLAGKYHDSSGRQYTFSVDGRAVWPDRKFKYEVGLDYAFQEPDYLINLSEFDSAKMGWVAYAFRWQGDTLLLYHEMPQNPDDPEGMSAENTPFAVLRRN